MPDDSTTSLMGYARKVLQRDQWTCRYCGLDGRVWPNWLYLSWDHLLSRDDPRRDDDERGAQEFIVAACFLCNVSHNRTRFAEHGDTPAVIIEKKRKAILEKRAEYRAFWLSEVAPSAPPPFDVITSAR